MAEAISVLARAQQVEVVHLTTKFAPDTPDIDWISALRQEGDWIIVSGDTRIIRSPPEREAWHESGLTAFFFDDHWANRRFWAQAEELVRWFPIIIATARTCARGSGFRLPFNGRQPQLIYEP